MVFALLSVCSYVVHLAVCRFVLGKRMGCLSDQVPQDCQELIVTVQEMFDSTQRLMNGPPLHIVWSTKEWKFQKQKVKHLYELSLKHVKEKLQEIREEDRGRDLEGSEAPDKMDFLTYLVHSGKQSLEEAVTNSIDLMLAGVDTVSCFSKYACRILNHPPHTGFISCRHRTPLPGVCTTWEGTQRSRRSCAVRFRGL